jgi:tetratricopeptide (TPR) repeat protein
MVFLPTRPRTWMVLVWTFSLVYSFPVIGQEADPEEVKAVTTNSKFVTVLEKNPRRGTALDKVYGFYVERGTLDGFIKTYREKAAAAKGAPAASSWMIVGLMESLRGQDAASVEAFSKAEELDDKNYLSPYYLGQALVLVGQPDKAAEALERAIQRKPAPADQLEVFQTLGRVYQRAQKNDKALEVWNRLEKQFPNDARVQEQIATTLLEENEFTAALPRFENLAKTSKDKYRQSQFQMEASEIKVRLGKSDEAIKEFEKLLGQLNPDNWLFREVRRRIENVYLRTDDQAGLIGYYEAWTKKNPEDLEAISRLARLLAGLGRGAEAQSWLEKGLKSAPSRKELRNALIAQLVYEQKFPEAIVQYEQLDKYEPNNPDTLRDWGRLILKDTKRDEATRKKDAGTVWRRLTTAKPKDPLIASQVAELFRHAEMIDDALALYRKSIELSPESAQYKEYLGEYFHSLQRKDEAMATWRQMAEGKAKTAANLARLAEVLAGFGYLGEAVDANAEACKLDPKEINLQIKQADLLSQAEKHDESLKQLAVVQKLAANDEEREAWLQRELKELQTLEQLKDRIAAARMELEALPAPASDKEKAARSEKWFWLARAHEAERQLKEAAEAVSKAADLAPQSVPILMSTARILEAQQNLLAAVETNTKLAAIDRRYRTEYLKKVAQLEVQLGRREKAIQAGRDVLAAAPGNPELYEFFSQLCFQLGENEEGLQALRRSVRVNPTEPKGLLLLASALGEQFRTGESIELYWRAFDKANNLEDRLSVVPRLTELYLQTNQFDRLLERLENRRREPNQQREMTICIAQAYQSAGDDGNARQELEKLLTEDTRDTQLLQQLVKLCEQDGDLEAAIRFQHQMTKIAPGKEGTMRLAQLLMKSGDSEEATALLTRATADEKDPEQLIKSVDSLLTQKNYDQVLGILERLVRDQPKNWELLYRQGVALASTKPEEATRRFETILAMNINDDEQTLMAKNQAKKNTGRQRSPAIQFRQMNPFMQRLQYTHTIRQAVGLDQNNYYGGGYPQQQQFWAPHDFGTARLASLAWLQLFAKNAGKEEDFLKQRRTAAEKSTDRRPTIDAYHLAALRNDSKEQYEILKKLSQQPGADIGIKSTYLTLLGSRGGPQATAVVNEETGEREIKLDPLDKEELEHVLAIYKELDDATSMMNYGQTFLEVVAAELKRAGHTEDADQLFQQTLQAAKSPMQIASVMAGTIQRGDYVTTMKLLDRLAEMKSDTSANATAGGYNNYSQYVSTPQYQAQILAQLMAKRAQKKELGDVLGLWDRYLAIAVTRHDADKKLTAATRKRNANNNPYGSPGYFYIWRGNNQQHEQVDFPTPNAIYDHSSLQMLRQTFAVYKDVDSTKTLIDHFQQKLKDDKTPAQQQIFWKLGLGYLFWWNEDRDDSLTVLTEATNSLAGDEEMAFELARLHEKRGDPQEALAIIEALPAADQQTMQKREIAALRLSVNSGNIDRARTAAERLFGLRLDSNLQIQLSRQMHQLGMHEQAEAVLSRAGRQAGNKTDVLMNLMQQYQSQSKNDVATQIAHQLLRRSAGSAAQYALNSGRRSGRDDSGARQQALQVLKRSGKLPEMTKKVEDQLAHSPKSQKLIETLIEYYTAADNSKKVAELSAKYAETKGDDPQFRYQLAMQLVRDGKHKEALEHFKVSLKKDPRLLRNGYWEIQNAFESADKLDDLATLYEEIDLKSFRQSPYELTNLISNMSRRDKTKDRSISLFKKAWADLPDQRAQLLSNLNSDVFWNMPEIYDYARQGIIPTETSLAQTGAWTGFGNIQSWNNEGKMTTLLSRILAMAAQSKKLDALATEVAEARGKLKNWQAGEPLLAMIDLRRGRVDEGKAVFEKLLPTMKGVQQVGYYTHWEIAQELMAHESCIDLAILYLEAATKESEVMNGNEFTYTPGKALVNLYRQRGRKDDARRVILKAINDKTSRNYGNREYEVYQKLRNTIALGKEVRTLGYPVDAIRLYQEALSRGEDLVTAQRYGGDNIKNELQNGFKAALEELRPETLPELLTGSLGADGKAATPVDLVLLVESRDLDKASMTSALGRLLADLAKKPGMLPKTRDAIADVVSKRPEDLSVLILDVQLAISTGDTNTTDKVLQQLTEVLARTPLEQQPAKGGFTANQKAVALQETALWLLARDCLKQEKLRDSGQILATRALEASRRNSDNGYTMAILREWGQIAFDSGDKVTAEKRWTEMLDLVIPKSPTKAKDKEEKKTSWRERPVPQKANEPLHLTRWEQMLAPVIAAQLATPTLSIRSANATPSTGGTKGNVVTLVQFEQAAQIATLAAEHGLADLSVKAISQALHAGPPIEVMQADQSNSSGFPTIAQPQASEQSPVLQKVEQRLTAVVALWRKKAVDDVVIYEVLKHAVLPETRPLELFLYPRPLATNPNQTPQSVGLLLVQAAVRAKKVDELNEAIATRLKQPLGELAGRVLATQLALATNDTAAVHQQLELLSTRLKQDSLQYSSELACHVAVPALTMPDLPVVAIPLLERAIDHFTQNMQQGRASSQEEPMRTYHFALARLHFRAGNNAAGKKHLEDYLAFLVPMYRNYSGDYGQQRRRQELMKIAAEYARAGLQADSLDCLGQYADLPVSRNYGQDSPGRAGALILSGLAQIPAAEQYELLKQWTLPTADRKSLRVITCLLPTDHAPAEFDTLRGTAPRGTRQTQLFSTADLLTLAANEVGKLDELRQLVLPHVEQNLENARFVLLLIEIGKGDESASVAFNAYLDERRKALPGQGDYQKRPQVMDAILAQAAMRDPSLAEAGRQLELNFFLHGSRVQEHLLMGLARHDYNASLIGEELASRLDHQPTNTGLKHWTASSTVPARTEAAGAVPMWWIAQEGLLTHICGPDQSHLYFKYPLAGTFELSCEGWFGGWAEANSGFGGVVFQGLNGGSDTSIFAIGNRGDAVRKPDPPEKSDHYNRIKLSVTPDKIQYTVNGHLIHTEPYSTTTSPWFFLQCDRVWQTCFRNIQITGHPEVPAEVRLSHGESLLGWSSDFYGESQPPRTPPTNAASDEREYDWWSTAGVIHGRLMPSNGYGKAPVQQSRLYYGRPLVDGDQLQYEFWYEPGAGGTHVHPAFDRLAMLLDPDGLKLHWMTDGSSPEDAYGGLAADHTLVDASIRRDPVKLKDNAWNQTVISMKGNIITIQVNGSVVCERPLEDENSRQFGFYHDKHATAVKVRNVTLTGDWPKALTDATLANLLAPSLDRNDADRRTLSHAIEEKFRATDLEGILLQTRSMPLADRYESLKDWVLPNVDHDAFRLYADNAPADPLPVSPIVLAPAKRSTSKKVQNSGGQTTRVRSGGDLIGPALDLVAVAKELGKLDELRKLVQKVPPSSEQIARSRLAMLVLLAIAADDLEQAAAALKELTPARDKGLSDSLSMTERWPELVAAWEASYVPELCTAANLLLDLVLDSTNRKGVGTSWDIKVRSAKQYARAMQDKNEVLPTASGRSPKGQWAQHTLTRASNRAAGMVPRWQFKGSESLHLGGEGNDLIYFQSPLRGSFTVEGELSTYGWREARIMYAAQWAGIQYTNEAADLGNLYSHWVGPKFAKKLDPVGEWCYAKLVVTPEKASYFVNEQLIHENLLGDNCDPWFAIYSFQQFAASTRFLRITGEPDIPAELLLSKREDLQGWWADMYGDVMSGDTPVWKKDGEEIVGNKIVNQEGRSRESLLQYHRPMLEDGEISYDFLYVPKQTHIHPTLGRMVMMLAEDGVKIHWLTDAQFERGGLAPDNLFIEQERRRGTAMPLKAGDWNKVNLKLKGDVVTLTLNGDTIYERPVDSNNLRNFGFFRYACDTDARIKNVVYRGNWPKSLPSLKDQELAGDDPQLVNFKDGELPATFSWNFQGKRPAHLDLMGIVPTSKFSPVEGGLKIERGRGTDVAASSAGIQWNNVSVGGDFEVTVDYRNFQSSTKAPGHTVPRIELLLGLGGRFGHESQALSVAHRRNSESKMEFAAVQGVRRDPANLDWSSKTTPTTTDGGRLRISRRSGIAYFLHAPAGTDDWTLIERRPVSTEDIKELFAGFRSEDLDSTGSVVLTRFSVRARNLTYVPRFSEEDLPAKVAWNFQGTPPKGIQAVNVNAPNRFEPTTDGMKITRPEAPRQNRELLGYKWRGKLKGDFEVTVGFRDFESKTDKTDWQIPRIEIHIPIGADGSPWNIAKAALIGHRNHLDGKRIAEGISERQPDGVFSWKNSEKTIQETSGRLRIVRVGSTISTLAAPGTTEDWATMATRNGCDEDINTIWFSLRSESAKSSASIKLTEFSIRAKDLESDVVPLTDAMPLPAPFKATDLPAKVEWNFQGAQPSSITNWGLRKQNSVASLPDGIKILRSNKIDNTEIAVGYALQGSLIGDFEITMDFRDFASTAVQTDWRVPRVDLSASIHANATPEKSANAIGASLRRNQNGDIKLLASQGDVGADGKINWKAAELATDLTGCRLRLVRQGVSMFYQFALPGSDSFQTFALLPVETGPVRHVTMGLRAEDLEASGEAVLTNVIIRAKEIQSK